MKTTMIMHVAEDGKTATFDAGVSHCPDDQQRVFTGVARVLDLDGEAPGLELTRPLGVRAVRSILDQVFDYKGWPTTQ